MNNSLPASNVKELIAYGKGRTDPLNYAAPGVGSMGHLAAELFKRTFAAGGGGVKLTGGDPAFRPHVRNE